MVKLNYNSKLIPDPGLVLQTPLCNTEKIPLDQDFSENFDSLF